MWKGLGAQIDFDKKPIVKIKSIYVKEYSGRICLASHDNTQIFTEPENILKEEKKIKQITNGNKKVASKEIKELNNHPKEFSNYRVICLRVI